MVRMKNEERISRVRQLWVQRPEDKRSENDVLMFHAELTREHPELLNGGHGDSYQHLKSEVGRLVRED